MVTSFKEQVGTVRPGEVKGNVTEEIKARTGRTTHGHERYQRRREKEGFFLQQNIAGSIHIKVRNLLRTFYKV